MKNFKEMEKSVKRWKKLFVIALFGFFYVCYVLVGTFIVGEQVLKQELWCSSHFCNTGEYVAYTYERNAEICNCYDKYGLVGSSYNFKTGEVER